jgi:glutamate-1-semialdehyde 2,1-aminomutase
LLLAVFRVTNITADIVCFGKVIGGGLPVGAFAAQRNYNYQVC